MSTAPRTLDPAAAREWVVGYLADLLHIDRADVDLTKDLTSFGLDSVDAVVMGAAMEERFDLEMDPSVFIEHRNFQEMLNWLSAHPLPAASNHDD